MITVTTAELGSWVGALLWPFMRIGAMLLAAPVFGAQMIPVRVRLVLALAMALMMAPLVVGDAAGIDPLSATGMLVSVQQILIGLAMGFVLQIVFTAMVVAGQSMAMSMGLGFATAVDPQNGIQVPVVSQYYVILATLMFLALNGHLLMIQMLAESFSTLPVNPIGLSREGLWVLIGWAGRMFEGAVLIALTALTAMLLVNLAFGVMSRAAPQLNIFGVGFPVMIGAGFVVILLSMPALLPQLSGLMLDAFELLGQLLAIGG